jgi:Zn-finger nucleic acid-binding protein
MVIVEYNEIELDYCTKCRGVWFDAGKLELLLESAGLTDMPHFLEDMIKAPEDTVALREKVQRSREVSDVILRLNKYRIVACDCGAKW